MLDLSWLNWLFSFTLVFQWCCLIARGSEDVIICCFCLVLISDSSSYLWFVSFLCRFIDGLGNLNADQMF